jgi:hypothetical protein
MPALFLLIVALTPQSILLACSALADGGLGVALHVLDTVVARPSLMTCRVVSQSAETA